jgi:hypothetical protein
MQRNLNFARYRELEKKEKTLMSEQRSLLFENKSEFLEFLSYSSQLHNWVSYQEKEKYYLLISQYLDGLIPTHVFQWKFLELERNDGKSGKILLNDIKESESFAIDLIAIKFGSLLSQIYDLSATAWEFGPVDGISDEKFLESIQKIYSKMLLLK